MNVCAGAAGRVPPRLGLAVRRDDRDACAEIEILSEPRLHQTRTRQRLSPSTKLTDARRLNHHYHFFFTLKCRALRDICFLIFKQAADCEMANTSYILHSHTGRHVSAYHNFISTSAVLYDTSQNIMDLDSECLLFEVTKNNIMLL